MTIQDAFELVDRMLASKEIYAQDRPGSFPEHSQYYGGLEQIRVSSHDSQYHYSDTNIVLRDGMSESEVVGLVNSAIEAQGEREKQALADSLGRDLDVTEK